MPRMLIPVLVAAVLLTYLTSGAQTTPELQAAVAATPPPSGSLEVLRFAVIGDNGTGDRPQLDVARQMAAYRKQAPYDLVLMLGDNLYTGRSTPREFTERFEQPYSDLLEQGVRFYAVLGNHDDPANRLYPGFNMNGQRYYSYARGDVRFFALDTNVLDGRQLEWFEAALKSSLERWKIAYFHHAIYSHAARHGSNVELRVRLEPLLVRYGVNVVFSGHDHVYERLEPQKGISYFVAGSGGKLRHGMDQSGETAAYFDREQSFMLIEIAGDRLTFRAISRTGKVVDSGVIERRPAT